jgi:hypothetical protein
MARASCRIRNLAVELRNFSKKFALGSFDARVPVDLDTRAKPRIAADMIEVALSVQQQ